MQRGGSVTIADDARRMILYGFCTKDAKEKIGDRKEEELKQYLKMLSDEEVMEMADLDEVEMARDQLMKVAYPTPQHKLRLIYEAATLSVEESYFWLLNHIRDLGYPVVDKITDVFTSSEMSAFFGVQQQRIGLQQDKVAQFLATIGKMIKDLFQLVREMRILDERLKYYYDSEGKTGRPSDDAEITLKGIYVDQVEGASKNPASVYGLASQLEFTTLPDLFYSIHPRKMDEISSVIDKLQFNNKVKEVLKRKLRSYLGWKLATMKELETRRKFTLKYLRQHYDIIHMYMNWVKPYLKNLKRLAPDEEKAEWPDLIGAFETANIEIEVLGRAVPEGNQTFQSVIVMHLDYRAKPQLNYQAEGYQRGPIHIGRIRVSMRAYGWDDKTIENYKKMREHEDLDLISTIDGSVKAAMEALGDELRKYIEEAGEKYIYGDVIEKKEKKEEKPPGFFYSFGKGFNDVFAGFSGAPPGKAKPKKKSREQADKEKKEQKLAAGNAQKNIWTLYKNYKKSHKLITW